MFLPCLPMCLQALDETIQLLIDMAFTNNWFNETYEIHLSREDLVDLLKAATKGQLFIFNGQLYEQTDQWRIQTFR